MDGRKKEGLHYHDDDHEDFDRRQEFDTHSPSPLTAPFDPFTSHSGLVADIELVS